MLNTNMVTESPFRENLYEILSVERTATIAEIEQAFQKAKLVFLGEHDALYTLFDDGAKQAVWAKIELAYRILRDTARRQRYDRQLSEGAMPPIDELQRWLDEGVVRADGMSELQFDRRGQRQGESSAVNRASRAVRGKTLSQTLVERLKDPALLGGEFLKLVREDYGVTLDEIASETRIGAAHLRFIESEQFHLLPAKAYVRGFVAQLVALLKLPKSMVEHYMSRYPPVD